MSFLGHLSLDKSMFEKLWIEIVTINIICTQLKFTQLDENIHVAQDDLLSSIAEHCSDDKQPVIDNKHYLTHSVAIFTMVTSIMKCYLY